MPCGNGHAHAATRATRPRENVANALDIRLQRLARQRCASGVLEIASVDCAIRGASALNRNPTTFAIFNLASGLAARVASP
jgi:hypothetical protein